MLLVISSVFCFVFGFYCVLSNASDYTTLYFIGLVHLHPSKYSFPAEYLSISFRKCIKNILISQRKPRQIYCFGRFFFIFLNFSPLPMPNMLNNIIQEPNISSP